jgi:hypothetical protein
MYSPADYPAIFLRAGAYSLYLWRARKNVPGHMSTPRQGLASGLVLGSLIFSAALVSYGVSFSPFISSSVCLGDLLY